MSSILEALEKAEGERRQGVEPGLRPAPHRPARRGISRSLLVGAVVLLLVLNLVFWWFYLKRSPVAEPVAVAPTATPASSSAPASPETKPAPEEPVPPPALSLREQLQKRAAPSAKPLFEEARLPVKPVVDASPAPLAETPMAVETPAEPATVEPPVSPRVPPVLRAPAPVEKVNIRQAPVESAPPALASLQPAEELLPTAAAEQDIPVVWELPQDIREKVLSLKSSIHVYSEQPEQRFVIINMHRYGEGDSLPPHDFLLQRIDQDGVVIDYGDGLVRLPRR